MASSELLNFVEKDAYSSEEVMAQFNRIESSKIIVSFHKDREYQAMVPRALLQKHFNLNAREAAAKEIQVDVTYPRTFIRFLLPYSHCGKLRPDALQPPILLKCIKTTNEVNGFTELKRTLLSQLAEKLTSFLDDDLFSPKTFTADDLISIMLFRVFETSSIGGYAGVEQLRMIIRYLKSSSIEECQEMEKFLTEYYGPKWKKQILNPNHFHLLKELRDRHPVIFDALISPSQMLDLACRLIPCKWCGYSFPVVAYGYQGNFCLRPSNLYSKVQRSVSMRNGRCIHCEKDDCQGCKIMKARKCHKMKLTE